MPRKPKPPTTPPSNSIPAPTGLAASVVDGAVVLTWNAVSNATSYWIYRNSEVIAIYTSTTFTDRYVTAGYEYSYQVAAVVASVLGPKSTRVTISSLDIPFTATS